VPGAHAAVPGRQLELEGFPVADISDYLADGSVTIWLDLRGPDRDDLAVLSEEFGLHLLAVEAALRLSQRPKLDRYRSHLLLTAYGARLGTGTGELTTSEIAAFITSKALITVRQDDGWTSTRWSSAGTKVPTLPNSGSAICSTAVRQPYAEISATCLDQNGEIGGAIQPRASRPKGQ